MESNDKNALENLREWANASHSYLSESTEYARGYKAGISQAKIIVNSFLKELNIEQIIL